MPVVVLRHSMPKRFIYRASARSAMTSESTALFPSPCSIFSTTMVTLTWSPTLFVVVSAAKYLTMSLQTCNAEGDGTSTTLSTFNRRGPTVIHQSDNSSNFKCSRQVIELLFNSTNSRRLTKLWRVYRNQMFVCNTKNLVTHDFHSN